MKHIISIIALAVLLNSTLLAQDLPEKPNRLVNDYAGILSNQEVNYLERKLVNYNDTTSTQITVLIVNSLNGYDVEDYAQRVGQKWGAGQKGKDNGVIIVIKPKTANSKGEVNIDIGYGLEPIIPDITAKRIVENEMIPHFKNNDDYIGGLDAATNVIIALAAGQFSADSYNKGNGGGNSGGFFIPIIVLIIVISMINRRRRGTYSAGARGSSLPFWTALMLGSTMGRGHGGSWNSFNSGSGGFGGGGGFGGFGGGGFGGGGASGSW